MSSSSEEAEFRDEEEEPSNDEDDSDDEEDIPLAQLAARKKKPDEVDDDDDDDDDDEEEEEEEEKDISLAQLASSSRRKSKVNYKEDNDDNDDFEWEDEPSPTKKRKSSDDNDDDDDDDDPPLSALKSKTKKITNGDAKKNKNGSSSSPSKAKTKVKNKPDKIKSVTTTTTATTTNENYQSVSAALYGSGCEKGLLIQRLLCRWWYAMEWPDPKRLPAEPPAHYESLDGFPGVYVCTSGDKVGHVWDMRDKDKAPNFVNMSNKTSADLQELLVKALEAQKRELVSIEGNAAEKELNDMIKWAKRIKPASADAEAKKVLKAAKFNKT